MTSSTVGIGHFTFHNDTADIRATEGEELRNEKALSVYNRVQSKLTGTFTPHFPFALSY